MIGKTILLVEDNPKVMRNNTTLLTSRGARVIAAENLAEARLILSEELPDVAVLDIMLPDGSGLDLLREFRRQSTLPVLLLSAKGKTEDVVTGLSLGADDYIAKPYDLNEFAARIDALIRRAGTIKESATIGSLRFDLLSNQAFYGDVDLLLTQKEFSLLLLLAQNERKILSAEYLFEKAWGQPMNGDTGTFKVQMSNLKKKLTAVTSGIIIETSRGKGYILTML